VGRKPTSRLNPLENHHFSIHSGALSMFFHNGFLRYIKHRELEVIRTIGFAVRDANWETVPLKISNVQYTKKKTGFVIRYTGTCQQADIDFRWKCFINLEDNQLSFEIEGIVFSEFETNRIGFFLLHPIENYTGLPVKVTHSDGKIEKGVFPELISPHQHFKDIARMEWSLAHTTTYKLLFEGAQYEMEDQRNWLDASYKTYCTPLHLPFPVTVQEGHKVKQGIDFNFDSENNIAPPQTKEEYNVTLKAIYSGLPLIGIEANLEHLDQWAVDHIAALNLGFLRIELKLGRLDWKTVLQQKIVQANKLDLPIELVIFTRVQQQPIVQLLEDFPWDSVVVRHILLIDDAGKTTGEKFMASVLPQIRKLFPKTPIGGGTDYYFTELNRNRPPSNLLDFYSFSANPQVHATDDLSILETNKTFTDVVLSAQQFSGGKPIHISPVTLRPRSNPNATDSHTLDTMVKADLRQKNLLTAQWMLGAVKYMTEAGTASACFFETLGDFGILNPQDSELFPVYEVFAFLGRHTEAELVHSCSSHPLLFDALVLKKQGVLYYALANYSKEHLTISVDRKSVSLKGLQLYFSDEF